MNAILIKFRGSSLHRLYRSFTPASRAVILFALPFMVVDAIHYFTAGTALIISFPLLALVYLACGALAAGFARHDGQGGGSLPGVGRSAGLRLWLTSTVVNILISLLLGFFSLGISTLMGTVALCLYVPFHALISVCCGWLGGWLYQEYIRRTKLDI